MVRGTTTSYYNADGLGSIIALTDSTGAIVERYRYDVFGQVQITDAAGNLRSSSAFGNRFLFTGRELDAETALYYYRARYYNPKLGRFLQRDPVGYSAGINLYSYVDNNPINWLDPRGLDKGKTPWSNYIRNLLSVFQRGFAGALSALNKPIQTYATKTYTIYTRSGGVYGRLEELVSQTTRPYQNFYSSAQGLGLVLSGRDIAIDPLASVAEGRLDTQQARAVVAIRSFETIVNVRATGFGIAIGGSFGGPLGAAAGAVIVGTGSTLLTRKIGNSVLELMDVPVQ